MAINLGTGISIGQGVRITGLSAATLIPNTFKVAISPAGSNYPNAYGASSSVNGYYPFGYMTSNYIISIMYYTITQIILLDGSYAGFNISFGSIDGDLPSYPRLFTIGGNNYELQYSNSYRYIASGDTLGLLSKVGNTISCIYNPYIQTPVTPNTIRVSSITATSGSGYWYGAGLSKGPLSMGGIFGVVVSDYIQDVYYSTSSTSPGTYIYLKDGTYSGFSVSGGAIDGDTNGSTRKFSFNGISSTLTYTNSFWYFVGTDVFNLQSNVNNTISALYDPTANGGGATTYWANQTPNADYATFSSPWGVYYHSAGAYIEIIQSAWSNLQAFNNLLKVKSGSVLQLDAEGYGTFQNFTSTSDWVNQGGGIYRMSGLWMVPFDAGITDMKFTYIPTTTYTLNVDYQYNGVTIDGNGNIFCYPPVWSNSAGATAMVALSTGSTINFTFTTLGINGSLTLTSGWTNNSGLYSATFTTTASLAAPMTPDTVAF